MRRRSLSLPKTRRTKSSRRRKVSKSISRKKIRKSRLLSIPKRFSSSRIKNSKMRKMHITGRVKNKPTDLQLKGRNKNRFLQREKKNDRNSLNSQRRRARRSQK